MRTLAVLAGLLSFLLFYLFLIATVGYLGYELATHPPRPTTRRAGVVYAVVYLGGLAALAMLFLFLLKGLLKWNRSDRSHYLKLRRSDQPRLFAFIDQVCRETGAPRPSGVYLSPDINAAVFYNTSILNLILPLRKHLLIGAGLVEAVNPREFKAVLAHEFGHFSQKSLGLSTYVWVINRIVGDMVHSRDIWDQLLHAWCSLDIRYSFPAWILQGVVNVIRSIMSKVFKAINLLDLSLSRQMEFNADDVAVSVAGSDAIVTSLYKLEFADRCFDATSNELSTAADHRIFSKDIYYHQSASAEYLRVKARDPLMGVPPVPPALVFESHRDTEAPVMWQTHPANHDREANAKRSYFPAPPDERSPWILFQNVPSLKEALSHQFYEHNLGKTISGTMSPPEAVQSFIQSERAETQFDPKYHGLFDNRVLSFADIPSIPPSDPRPATEAKMLALFQNYPRPGLKKAMAEHEQRRKDYEKLVAVENGSLNLKGTTISIRGEDYSSRDCTHLRQILETELEADHKRFGAWDSEMYELHYQAAHQLSPNRAAELRRRYVFLQMIQTLVVRLNDEEERLHEMLDYVQGTVELPEDDYEKLLHLLRAARDNLLSCQVNTTMIKCPEMTNVAEGTKLSDLLSIDSHSQKAPRFNSCTGIKGEDVQKLIHFFHTTQLRLRRVFFKGLGNILTRQERIAADFLATRQEEPILLTALC